MVLTRQVFSVSQLTQFIKDLLWNEPVLREVAVRGEISNFKRHTSGHLYFTLKDQSSSLRSVMFRSHAASLAFRPHDGLKVIAAGHITVYERDGAYQLYVRSLEPDGLGSLYLALEQLKKKLEQEGLFDPGRKRALPRLPRRVGVVTSLQGAAVRDIITVSRRRFPNLPLVIVDVAVQGAEAPERICQGLELVARVPEVDVVIVGRGGGSVEELWAFNDETVVRAVAACPVPVVSAVGHETDFTLADFAADVRAPTPSAAAELVVPDRAVLERSIEQAAGRLRLALVRRTELARARWKRAVDSPAMRRPQDRLHQLEQRVDELTRRLGVAAARRVEQARGRSERLSARLDALSPLAVLARGYSVCLDSTGAVIRSIGHVVAGEELEVLVADGSIGAAVTGTRARPAERGEGHGTTNTSVDPGKAEL
ncbi:MAG: exodeoxyribonuclease VII large subunit [Bacillota bacterium]